VVFFKVVTPAPAPRRLIPVRMRRELLAAKAPGLSNTTCPAGQRSSADWMRALSSVTPSPGLSVTHIVVRFGIPPFDIKPGFHAKYLSLRLTALGGAGGRAEGDGEAVDEGVGVGVGAGRAGVGVGVRVEVGGGVKDGAVEGGGGAGGGEAAPVEEYVMTMIPCAPAPAEPDELPLGYPAPAPPPP